MEENLWELQVVVVMVVRGYGSYSFVKAILWASTFQCDNRVKTGTFKALTLTLLLGESHSDDIS